MTKRIVVFLLLFISRARRFPAGKVIDILKVLAYIKPYVFL
jgi:hypothetical protein